jgi:hypothetical protein
MANLLSIEHCLHGIGKLPGPVAQKCENADAPTWRCRGGHNNLVVTGKRERNPGSVAPPLWRVHVFAKPTPKAPPPRAHRQQDACVPRRGRYSAAATVLSR